jgi:multiple sugar transport system substrate-binding protein
MLKKIGIYITWAIIIISTLWAFFFYEEKELYPGKVVVNFATYGGVAEEKAWKQMIDGFEKEYPNIKIKLTLIPLKYQEKILSLLAADIAPDIFVGNIVEMKDKNVFRPIDDFLQNDKDWDTTDLLEGLSQLGYYYGHKYEIVTSIGPLALFYNVKHFKEAGLKTPNEYAAEGKWNFETFLECCKKLVKRDKDGNTIRWAYRIYADYIIYLYITANGGMLEVDKNYGNYTDPKIVDALQKWADLSNVYKVSPPIIAEEQAGVSAAWKEFQRGNVSMMHSGPWMIGRLKGMSDPYDVSPPPFEPGGKSLFLNYGSVTGIWSKSKHPYEAYLWLKYIASKEGRIIWSKLGFDLPGYKSLWKDKHLWVDTTKVPKHFDVFYELAKNALTPVYSHTPATTIKCSAHFQKIVWERIRKGEPAKKVLEEELPTLLKYNIKK